jgi:signal transduction histidine kinase
MANRILDFSKKRNRHIEPCDIAELISDALRFVQPYVRTKFIEVHVHVEPLLPAIDADRWQMVQAIVNLLQNAADAMAGVNQRTLSISAGIEKKQVQIVISDTGSGIAKSDLTKIFEPFFTTKGDCGTGLGLYITRQVIEEHGGTIDVQTSSRGTNFVIGLPLPVHCRS